MRTGYARIFTTTQTQLNALKAAECERMLTDKGMIGANVALRVFDQPLGGDKSTLSRYLQNYHQHAEVC